MKKEDYARELREQWYRTIQEDQRFYIRYSAAGLGLLMTLQAVSIGKDVVYGPLWLWVLSLVSFLSCLVIAGPICYYYDAKHYYQLALEIGADGAVSGNDALEPILKRINRSIRAAFVLGCVSAVAYFICQRALAAG